MEREEKSQARRRVREMCSAEQKLPFVDVCSKALLYSPRQTSNSPVAAARSIFPLLPLSAALPISLIKILF